MKGVLNYKLLISSSTITLKQVCLHPTCLKKTYEFYYVAPTFKGG